MTEAQRIAFIAIVGRPNVGKSTLLNALLGQKVSITSNKPQTTRHRILGIDTEGDTQLVFVDTPGIHSDEKKAMNRLLNRAATGSTSGVDAVLMVVEAQRWTAEDALVLKTLQRSSKPVMLVVNKIDLLKDKASLLPKLQQLASLHPWAEIIPLSAETGDQVPALRQLVRQYAKQGVHHYPDDYVTDRSVRFMAAEIIREKLMRFTGDELPYSATVEIEQYQTAPSGVVHIHALILVEREGQKRMVIGAGGQKLKTIGAEARKDIEALIDQQVLLKLWVKVKAGWADDERALRSLGYGED